jgi:hypothetical protein
MNDAHLHMVVNHFPIIGTIFGLGILLAGTVTDQIIHEHEEMAEKLAIVLYALGLVSLIGLYLNFINHAKASIVSYFAMVIAIVGVFVGKQAGTTGGEIRHTEIRANANTAAVDQNGVREEGNDD